MFNENILFMIFFRHHHHHQDNQCGIHVKNDKLKQGDKVDLKKRGLAMFDGGIRMPLNVTNSV